MTKGEAFTVMLNMKVSDELECISKMDAIIGITEEYKNRACGSHRQKYKILEQYFNSINSVLEHKYVND